MQESGPQRSHRSAASARRSIALSFLGLAALTAALTAGVRSGPTARAALDPSVNMSISSAGCSSSGTPTSTCSVSAGSTFTVNFNLDALPSGGSYAGYDLEIMFTGVSYVTGSLQQMGAGVWPDCAFPAAEVAFAPGDARTGCAEGIGAVPSTYLGVMAKLGFICSSSGTVRLVHGDTHTALVGPDFGQSHSEAADESLTINCVAPAPTVTPGGPTPTPTATITPGGPTLTPTPTITPGGPTLTPTPTVTPGGPTLTPTPTITPGGPSATATSTGPAATVTPTASPSRTPTPASPTGDTNKDGRVNVIDAQLVLQYAAGLLFSINPSADANRDGQVNVIDAQLVLQYTAGLISHL